MRVTIKEWGVIVFVFFVFNEGLFEFHCRGNGTKNLNTGVEILKGENDGYLNFSLLLFSLISDF